MSPTGNLSGQSPETDNIMTDLHAPLERQYIQDYLKEQGYALADLRNLPKEKADHLMAEASSYASLRLAEEEMRSRFVEDLHGTGEHHSI